MEIITEALRDYLQSLDFETWTRRFLISWAKNKGLEKTDAFSTWDAELAEFEVEYKACREYIGELYPNGWRIPPVPPAESFGDQLTRMFPPEALEPMHSGGPHCKDITMQVTESCNMRCSYCYQGNKSDRMMDVKTAKRFIDYILGDSVLGDDPYINSLESSGVALNFIGGEPFIAIDLMEEVSDYFIERAFLLHHPWATRFMFSISSNGLLYFEPRVQAYLDKYAGHISLSISIDGNKELHDSCRIDADGNGTYDRAMEAVRHYVGVRHGHIGSKMTIAPGNVGCVCEAVKSLISNGYRDIHLNCVYEEGWTTDHARTLYKELCDLADYLVTLPNQPYISMFREEIGKPLPETENQNWCGGNGLMLAVDYKGDLFPCLRYMASSLGNEREPYPIGDIDHGVCNSERVECLKCVTRRSQSTDECFTCPIANGCAWCSAYNYQLYGTPDRRATFICKMHRARVLANEYYQKKLGKDYSITMPDEWREEIVNG